ncbi:Copia protein, partial [Mucuna pruriens]
MFEAWDDEDSLIMTWLWNSMTSEISRNYMFYSSIRVIWENLIETYSTKMDFAAYYDIESKIFNSKQGTLSVIKYYGTLNELWIELYQYQELKMCKADSIAYTGLVERGRIFKFLHGLNFEYDPVRVQILGSTQMWMNQTTYDKENVIEHPSTSQLNQDIQAFSKEEMDHLRAHLNSTSKPLGSCGLTMNGESYLEVEPVIESLPFPTQDVQVQVQEVTKPTLVPEQVQMFELDEALKDENWVQAMKEEMEALEKNSTWEIVGIPKDKRVVSCRWIYIVKCKGDLEKEVYMEIPPEFYSHNEKNKDRLWTKDPPSDIIILDDLKVKYERPIKLFCDNNSAISIAHNPVQLDRTKHIEIDRHFIKEKLDSGIIVTTHIPTRLQVADVFTKGLLATRFQELNDKLGMIDIEGSVGDIVNM